VRAFLRKRSKSQICGTLKNPYDYVEVESEGKIQSAISRPSFPPSLTEGSSSSGSGLSHERAATLGGAAWVPLELTEETNTSGAQRARVIKCLSAYGSSRSQANLSIYPPHNTILPHLPPTQAPLRPTASPTPQASDRVRLAPSDLVGHLCFLLYICVPI
jgi:hypothetical protein